MHFVNSTAFYKFEISCADIANIYIHICKKYYKQIVKILCRIFVFISVNACFNKQTILLNRILLYTTGTREFKMVFEKYM